MKNSTKRLLVVLFAVLCIAPLAFAQAPAAAPATAPAATAAVPPPPAPKTILDADGRLPYRRQTRTPKAIRMGRSQGMQATSP